MSAHKENIKRRAHRSRRQLKAAANGRLRLSVYRSNQNIYAQLIDDTKGRTLACASSLDSELKGKLKVGSDCKAAEAVGKLLAERATSLNVKAVVFDRGAYIYHGRIKALAEAARAGGLSF